jgi:cytochrome c-type biogenesis protein CcmH
MRARAALLILLLVAAPGRAWAAPDPQDVANEVAAQVMSPYCPGVTLQDCTSGRANELRDRIVGWAEDGMSERLILARLEDEFGPSIRAAPSSEGAGIVAWILPALALMLGAAGALVALRRWRARVPAARPAVALSGEDRRRIDDELRRFRSEP